MMTSNKWVALIGCVLFGYCLVGQSQATFSQGIYSFKKGQRRFANTNTTRSCSSSTQAAMLCQTDYKCHGANYSPADGLCELLLEPSMTILAFPNWISHQKLVSASSQCEWMLWENRCLTFLVDEAGLLHDQAQSACSDLGAELASLETEAKSTFVIERASDLEITNMHIGFSRNVTTSVFEWDNGHPVTFTYWGENEPDNQGERCVVASNPEYDYAWWDIDCLTWQGNVTCEKTIVY